MNGYIPFTIFCDGEKICEFERYFRHHDFYMQILEDDWRRVCVPEGKHTFEIRNNHDELCVAISRITLKPCGYNHGELSVPEWALKGEKVIGKVFSTKNTEIVIDGINITVDCKPGWNEFEFVCAISGMNKISTNCETKIIEIFDVDEENYPVKVGYDLTTIPHDNSGFLEWLLDYTYRTRLGNYIMFRNFNCPAEPGVYEKYGKMCRKYNFSVSDCIDTEFGTGELVKASGSSFSECGMHEYPGAVYAFDPMPEHSSRDMKEANEKYTEHLRKGIKVSHSVFPRAAFGDAAGGIRHSFIAGAGFVRAETMVPHTQALLSKARPAAEALGDGRWGAHIAIQHPQQP